MTDEAMQRLLAYDRRRYWLVNGWSIRFRIDQVVQTVHRPHGIKYSFTLHDTDGTRLLGFDNAHGVSRALSYDHRHRFGATVDREEFDAEDPDDDSQVAR